MHLYNAFLPLFYDRMKKILFRNIHLYLGLISGLIFFTECVTGLLLVFQDELENTYYKHERFVTPTDQLLPLSELSAIVQKAYPDKKTASVKMYKDADRSYEFSLSEKPKKEEAEKKDQSKGEKTEKRKEQETAYVDPYTSQILDVNKGHRDNFFGTVLEIHRTLLINNVGKTILAISTLMTFGLLITGIVLWWPKTRKILKTRLKIKSGAHWKRLTFDLHVVLGFYATFFLLMIIVTSLPWSYKWINDHLYIWTNSNPKMAEAPMIAKDTTHGKDKKNVLWDAYAATAKKYYPNVKYWQMSLPNKKQTVVAITVPSSVPLHRNAFDNLYLNPANGAIFKEYTYQETPTGWKIRRYMKPLHTFAIGGIPTKILGFLLMIISASFPITGVMMWINRQPKKKKTT